MTIRQATEQDASAIASLASELGYPVAVEAIQSRIAAIRASGTDLLLTAVDAADRITGWGQGHSAHLLESGFTVELTGLVVSRQFRRLGVGRLLIAELERWACDLGASTVILRSNVQRTESHPFYRALGYAPTKTSQAYCKVLASSQE